MWNFTSNNDRALYENTLAESISIFGLDIEYCIVNFDENKDKLYAEDSKPTITARYLMKAQSEYIQDESYMLTKFGIQTTDTMELIVSKSTFIEIVGEDSFPKSGDRVRIVYLDRWFTVASAKEDDNVFLQQKFSWKLELNPLDLIGAEVTPDIGIPDFEEMDGVFDDNDLIDSLVDGVIIEEEDDKSPWGTWES